MPVNKIPLLESCNASLPTELTETLALLNLPLCSSCPAEDFYLSCENGSLVLISADGEKVRPTLTRPARFIGNQPFLRALAPARGGTVIDATAGLGGDSLRLAMIADRVIAIERHPVVFALLVSALLSARNSSLSMVDKIEAHFGDAIEVIRQLPAIDVIFMDPMFPAKRKRSALPPKSVRILRDIVGDDTDDEKLLRIARQHAARRVVVKRPLHAPPLADDHVALHAGKVVRYEVYLPTSKQS